MNKIVVVVAFFLLMDRVWWESFGSGASFGDRSTKLVVGGTFSFGGSSYVLCGILEIFLCHIVIGYVDRVEIYSKILSNKTKITTIN